MEDDKQEEKLLCPLNGQIARCSMAGYNTSMASGSSSAGDNEVSIQGLSNCCEAIWEGWANGSSSDANGLCTWLSESAFQGVTQAAGEIACGEGHHGHGDVPCLSLLQTNGLIPRLPSSSDHEAVEAGSDTSELYIENSARSRCRNDTGTEAFGDNRDREEYSKSTEDSTQFLSRSTNSHPCTPLLQTNFRMLSSSESLKREGTKEKQPSMVQVGETELNSRTSSPVLPQYGLILQQLIGLESSQGNLNPWPNCSTSSSQHCDSGVRPTQEELANSSCDSEIARHRGSGADFSHSSDPYNTTSCQENMALYAELNGLLRNGHHNSNDHVSTAPDQQRLPISTATGYGAPPAWPHFPEISPLAAPPPVGFQGQGDAVSTAASADEDLSPSSTGTSISTILNTGQGRKKTERQGKRSTLDLDLSQDESGNSGPNKRPFIENSLWQSSAMLGRVSDPKLHGGSMTSNYSNASSTVDVQASVGPALNTNGKPRARRGSATDPQSVYARHRRERINERLKILQNLVPNGAKVDIVTMLEEAINYVKFLQLQVKLLSSDEYWIFAPTTYNGIDVSLGVHIGMESA